MWVDLPKDRSSISAERILDMSKHNDLCILKGKKGQSLTGRYQIELPRGLRSAGPANARAPMQSAYASMPPAYAGMQTHWGGGTALLGPALAHADGRQGGPVTTSRAVARDATQNRSIASRPALPETRSCGNSRCHWSVCAPHHCRARQSGSHSFFK